MFLAQAEQLWQHQQSPFYRTAPRQARVHLMAQLEQVAVMLQALLLQTMAQWQTCHCRRLTAAPRLAELTMRVHAHTHVIVHVRPCCVGSRPVPLCLLVAAVPLFPRSSCAPIYDSHFAPLRRIAVIFRLSTGTRPCRSMPCPGALHHRNENYAVSGTSARQRIRCISIISRKAF